MPEPLERAVEGIRLLTFDSAPAARMLVPAAFGESAPELSPDGRWLAYQSDETGEMRVYVRPFPGSGARVPVSLGGGTEPAWAPSGRELFYRSGDSVFVASVEGSASNVVGLPLHLVPVLLGELGFTLSSFR